MRSEEMKYLQPFEPIRIVGKKSDSRRKIVRIDANRPSETKIRRRSVPPTAKSRPPPRSPSRFSTLPRSQRTNASTAANEKKRRRRKKRQKVERRSIATLDFPLSPISNLSYFLPFSLSFLPSLPLRFPFASPYFPRFAVDGAF